MAKLKEINIEDLHINTDNFRFEPVESQKDAIAKMLEDQGEKLVNLAKHILENGLNPTDKIVVSPSHHDRTKFNVLEGNRRVIVLKLINNPNIIDTPKHLPLKKKIQETP